MKEERVIVAGFGGQGVIFASKVLVWAGLFDGKWVIHIPSYGPEIRGGTANGIAIISDGEIYSPVTEHPSSVIIMSQPSLVKFVEDLPKELKAEKGVLAKPRVKDGGLVIINASMIKGECKRKNVQIVKVNANEIAEKVGSKKVANMVALGAYLETRKILSWDSIFKGLEAYLTKLKKNKFLALNKKALEAGAKATK